MYALERDASAHSQHGGIMSSSKRRSQDPKRRLSADVSPGAGPAGPGQVCSQSLDLGSVQVSMEGKGGRCSG